MVAKNSSSPPGTIRPSTAAVAEAGNHVVLVAGLQHRRVGRVGHGGPDHPGDAAQLGERLLGPVGIELDLQRLRDCLQEGALSVGDPVRPTVVPDP